MKEIKSTQNFNLSENEIIKNGVFSHVFYVDKECYVYDVVSSKIFEVNPFLGEMLKVLSLDSKIYRNKGITALMKIHSEEKIIEGLNRIESYQEKNIFCPKPSNLEIKIDIARNKKESLTPNLNNLLLELTQDCNFRCTYCPSSGDYYIHSRKHSKQRMSKYTAFQSIDFFLKNTSYLHPEITFYGGEPLLQRRLIRECMQYAKNIKSDVKFRIQTNGFLLDEKFFIDIKDFDANVDISLDGPKAIHDAHRILPNGNGTFEKIIKNLLKLAQVDLDYMVRKFSLAITLHSTENANEISKFVGEHPILKKFRVRINKLSSIGMKEEKRKLLKALSSSTELDKVRDRYIKMYSEGVWSNRNVEHAMFFPILRLIINRHPLKSPHYLKRVCPIGNWKLFIDVNGNFHACERGYILPIIGNIEEGFNINKIIEMENHFVSTSKPCYKCWALVMCSACWMDIFNSPDLVDQKTKTQICQSKRKGLSDGLRLYVRVAKANSDWFDLIPFDRRK